MIINLLTSAIMVSTPLLLGSIAEVYSERTGMMVCAIEGIFLIGAWGGFAGSYLSGSNFVGILCAIILGMLMAALYAFLTITLRQQQVVTGTALNILAAGICSYFQRVLFGVPTTPLRIDALPVIEIPLLSDIPVLGPIFFSQNILTYIGYILIPVAVFVLYKTSLGLTIRSTGENPEAVSVAGLNVNRIRFLTVGDGDSGALRMDDVSFRGVRTGTAHSIGCCHGQYPASRFVRRGGGPHAVTG